MNLDLGVCCGVDGGGGGMMFTKKVGTSRVWSIIRDMTSCILTNRAFQIVFVIIKKKIGTVRGVGG